MQKEIIKIVITGHTDHGKSTLIGRLLLDTNSLPEDKIKELKRISKEFGKDTELAYLIDHLKEERKNEMTIDTSQIFFKTRKRNYVIIDSPGHLKFIKNMITGASQAETAVLLVDVKAGIKEQTRRHVYLLNMLGITNIIVAVNKMDLLDYKQARFEEVKIELLKFLKNLKIMPFFIIPLSVKEGDNISKRSSKMNWYHGTTLLDALDSIGIRKKGNRLPLRFPIQDVYKIDEEKILVGKVLSGVIEQGQTITSYPCLKQARINSIKIFGKNTKKTVAGQNIGLILDDSSFARRGVVIADTKNPCQPKKRFRGDIFWMSDEPLKINKPLTFRCATQEVICVAEKIEKRINSSTLEILEENASELKLNESGVVIFKTYKPIVVEKFDFIEELGRFVIEKDFYVQGAGIIT